MGCGSSTGASGPPQMRPSTTVDTTVVDKPRPSDGQCSNCSIGSTGKLTVGFANARIERSSSSARRANWNGRPMLVELDDCDDFDTRSANGMLGSRAMSCEALSNGGADIPALAVFINDPQECFHCHNTAVTHMCEECEGFYVCEDCMLNTNLEHDPTHAFTALHETQSSTSRTFGSSLMTIDSGTSNLFYDPCVVCGRVILDVEMVYHCEECNVVVCGNCFCKTGSSSHVHELKSFQRSIRGSIQNQAVLSKSRNSEGNKVINDYVVVKQLGRGAYAKVKLVQHRREHTLYALKILRRSRLKKTKRMQMSKTGPDDDDLLREIAVMKFVSHPNIVKLKEVIDDVEVQKVYVIMEYCENGPIYTYGDPPLSTEMVRKYGRDIIAGLLYMHGEHLFHRDIKPANCLLDGNGVVKIADFGTCCSQMRNSNTGGTPAYTCPEQCLGVRISGDIIDSWAFAVTLYQLAHGYLPVNADNFGELRNSLLGAAPISISPSLDEGLRDVLSQMLEKETSMRRLLREAARHPFFCMNSKELDLLDAHVNGRGPALLSNEIRSQAMKGVLRGKGLSSYYHGTRMIRKISRNEVNLNNSISDEILGRQCNNTMDNSESNNGYRNDTNRENNKKEGNGRQILQENSNSVRLPQAEVGASVNEIDSLQVVSMILETQREGKLEITNLFLHEIPAFLSDAATRTTALLLSNNGLSSVANLDFSQFSLLREVSITCNALTTFPVGVLLASRLQKLDLSYNRIVNVPPAVNRSRMLERLSLHGNCIKEVGVDASGLSVLAAPCLRHVRLSGNPLAHLPKALSTHPNLELVLDDAPALVNEWERIVSRAVNVVVVWNDIYPRQVHPSCPVFVASKNIHLYKMKFLDAIDIKHVVLLPIGKSLPLGLTESEKLERYIHLNQQENMGNLPEQSELPALSSKDSIGSGDIPHVPSPAHSLPPVLQRAAFRTVKSYFVIPDTSEETLGGLIPLRNHIKICAQLDERILFFLEEKRMSRSSREIAIGAICALLREYLGPEVTVNTCYQMVVDAMKGLYG